MWKSCCVKAVNLKKGSHMCKRYNQMPIHSRMSFVPKKMQTPMVHETKLNLAVKPALCVWHWYCYFWLRKRPSLGVSSLEIPKYIVGLQTGPLSRGVFLLVLVPIVASRAFPFDSGCRGMGSFSGRQTTTPKCSKKPCMFLQHGQYRSRSCF